MPHPAGTALSRGTVCGRGLRGGVWLQGAPRQTASQASPGRNVGEVVSVRGVGLGLTPAWGQRCAEQPAETWGVRGKQEATGRGDPDCKYTDVQSLSCGWDFAIPKNCRMPGPPSITVSQSLLN